MIWRADNAGPINEHYYLNGRQVGEIGNTGPGQTDFATAIDQAVEGAPAATTDHDQGT
ncbi:MAG: hypothetical protein ACREEW_18695 [Caulobacteraceae bacterium]